MDRGPRKYWFPAKRYGYGWGLPGTWQGWLVFGAYGALVIASVVIIITGKTRRAAAPVPLEGELGVEQP